MLVGTPLSASARFDGAGGGGGGLPASTVIVADRVVVPRIPVMVAVVFAVTANVVMVNAADVWPAGTVTMPGARATDALLVDSVTVVPPEGAGPLNVTVAGIGLPPVVLLTLGVTAVSAGAAFGSGKIVRIAVFEDAPVLAVIVAAL